MENRVLIAVDDSDNAMRAVKFVANHFTGDSKITLFNVIQDFSVLCGMNSPELTPYFLSQEKTFCSLEDAKKELVNTALINAKKKLIGAGFDEKNITIKTGGKKIGIAGDIVKEAEDGYDIVAIGRRGLSGIKDFFLGSVSQKVLNRVKNVSVLIVN